MKNKKLTILMMVILAIGLLPISYAQEKKDICVQVITPAIDPATGNCKEFKTPCDVPKGWLKTESCKKEYKKEVIKEEKAETMKKKNEEYLMQKKKAIEEQEKKAEMKYETMRKKEEQEKKIEAIKKDKLKLKEKADDFKDNCRSLNTLGCKNDFKELKTELTKHYVSVLESVEDNLNTIKETGLDVSKEIEKLKELNLKIGLISEKTTKEELRRLQTDLKGFVSKIKELSQDAKLRYAMAKFGGVIEKAEKLEVKLEKIVKAAENKGKDVSSLAPLINAFKDSVGKAREYQETATMAQNKKGAVDLMKKAQTELKNAHRTLTKIHQKIKDMKLEITEQGVQ